MKWLLDIGNGFCKYANYDNQIGSINRVPTAHLVAQFDEIFLSKSKQNSFFISNVAGSQIKESLQKFADDNIQLYFVQPDWVDTEITTSYDKKKLGVDRFVSLIFAWHQLKRSCIVLDCGTVATVDYLNNSGVHEGGFIFPSFNTALAGLATVESLNQYTQSICYTVAEEYANASDTIATDTPTAITQGSLYALIGTAKEVISKLRELGDADSPVLIAGGAANLIVKHVDRAYLVEYPVIKGLAILFNLGGGK